MTRWVAIHQAKGNFNNPDNIGKEMVRSLGLIPKLWEFQRVEYSLKNHGKSILLGG